MDPHRRRALLAALLTLPALALAKRTPSAGQVGALEREVLRLERESGGRLGFALLDTASGTRFQHRGGERFPMCSTFKLLLASAIVRQAETGEETFDRRIAV